MLSASLCCSNKCAITPLFSLSQTFVLFSPHCSLLSLSFHFKLSGTSDRTCFFFFSFTIRLQWVPNHPFLLGMTQPISWPDEMRSSSHPQSYVVSFLLHLISTRFKDSKRIVSSKFFDERVTLSINWGICASLSRSFCPLLSLLQQTQPSVELLPRKNWQNC